MKNILFIVLVAVLLFSGCSTVTTFESTPSGAKVYLDGELIGETPLEVKLSNFIGNPYVLELKKDGYPTFKTSINKEPKVGPILVGACTGFLPALLWCYGPKSSYSYELASKFISVLIIENNDKYSFFLDDNELKNTQNYVKPGEYSLKIKNKNEQLIEIKLNIEANSVYRLSDMI